MKTTRAIILALLGSLTVLAISAPAESVSTNAAAVAAPVAKRLPKLLDLGATKCIPCKKMAPILDALKKDYAGRLEVEFVDVWQNPDRAKQHNIQLIPTQIFFDAAGKELARHEGFISREDILAKWKALGVTLEAMK